jgi:hypothetical protein
MRKCSRTVEPDVMAKIRNRLVDECPRCGSTTNGHHLFDCPFVGREAVDPPDILNRVTDKVLNYRPKDRQPKPPKRSKPTKKKRKQNENDPATLR